MKNVINLKQRNNECIVLDKRRLYKSAHQRLMRDGVDPFISSDIYIKESKREQIPSMEDIEDTIFLLNDMGIFITDIPEFKSYGDLTRWKNHCIKLS